MRRKLTDATIRALDKPDTGYRILWDQSLPGFGCRVSAGGTKSFVVLIASGRPFTIGRYGIITLATARSEAKKLLAEKQLGRIRPTHTAFDDAKDLFLADCKSRNKPRTVSDYTRLLKHFPFERKSLADITAKDILRRISPLPPSEKHHAFTAARRFFRWCVGQHYIDRSPMELMQTPRNGSARKRVLSEPELAKVYTTALKGTSLFHHIVALLVLTGQRRGEIAALERPWISGDLITIPGEHTKNGRAHTFPIGKAAQAVIATVPEVAESPYLFPAASQRKETTTVFNGWGKPKAAFDKECGVSGWVLHDLRRSLSTYWASPRLAIAQVITEKYLNHVSGGALSPIAAIYNQHQYHEEMRDAAERWEKFLASLTAAS